MTEMLTAAAVAKRMGERFGERGAHAGRQLEQWLSGAVPNANPEAIRAHLREDKLDFLFDAFWQVLPFGTGGRRGPVGYGPNRMNFATVTMTVQGHCEYLKRAFPGRPLAVVVANDVRVFNDLARRYAFLGASHPLLGASSRSFARLACEVYAGNGVTVYFNEPESPDAVLSTPMLSHCIVELRAAGGINLSASHNPPDDNGIKVYDEYGSQPVAPEDQRLADAMEAVKRVERLPFDQALKRGLIRGVPEAVFSRYLSIYVKHFAGVYRPQPDDPPIVYTPLCGCGLTSVGKVLGELGFRVVSPSDQGPDGRFEAIPLRIPNPEVPQSAAPAKAFAESVGSRIVLCSDPDADRVGLEARLDDGSWYHFDGNQIAALLAYFLMLDPEGPRRRGLVIETLVTTTILGEIVRRAGNSWIVDDLLVGFKYVADVLKSLERTGSYGRIRCAPADLVMATEESHGVSVIPTIRDKDSTPACMYLATLYHILRRRGQTLLDYYLHILAELGGYDNVGRSIMMAGAAGVQRRDRIMEVLRASPPAALGGLRITRIVDHWDPNTFGPFLSDTDRLPRNVLQVFTETHIVTIRPSGTEPKIKVYCQIQPGGKSPGALLGMALFKAVREEADAYAARVFNDLLGIIGLRLDEAALALPDIVDLDRRIEFQERTLPALRQGLQAGRFASLSENILPWLTREAAAMTPGSNPLPAVRPAIARACRDWSAEFAGNALFIELRAWAG